MNPTLYDVLGVAPDASQEEIRRAWRDAADRFEPGQGGSVRQFRLFNEAAEILLDPEQRRTYDAGLADKEDAHAEVPSPAAEEAATIPGPPMPGAAPIAAAAAGTPDRVPARSGRVPPWWLLAVLAVLAATAVGLAAYFVTQAQRATAFQEALDRAPAAAETAALAVLSYDHETLEADRDAAARFLTEDYRKTYLETYELVLEGAPQAKATVEAEVLASAPMTVGERDADRVSVLVFVDQVTTASTSPEPTRALNRVQLDMVRVEGTWLVDDITSY